MFIGLFLSSPGKGGTSGAELSYTGYTRMPLQFTTPAPEGAGIGIRNVSQVTFPQSPINAGEARFVGVFDNPAGGNMFMFGELTEGLQVNMGDSPVLLVNEVLFFNIGDLSNNYKTRLFNVVRGTALNGFAPFLALFNGNPQAGGSEITGSNYQRQQMAFGAPAVSPGGYSVISNTARVDFPRPASDWGNCNHVAIFDAQSGGNLVWFQQKSTPMVLNRGVMPFVNTGGVTVGVS